MDLSRVFIRNLKKWRKITGLSQKTLADKCGTGCSYMRQIESGVGTPSFAMLAKIAEALEIEPYLLLYDETSSNGRVARDKHLESVKDKLIETILCEINMVFEKLAETHDLPPHEHEPPLAMSQHIQEES